MNVVVAAGQGERRIGSLPSDFGISGVSGMSGVSGTTGMSGRNKMHGSHAWHETLRV